MKRSRDGLQVLQMVSFQLLLLGKTGLKFYSDCRVANSSKMFPFVRGAVWRGRLVLTFEDVPLLELLGRGPQGEPPDELGADDAPVDLALLLRHLVRGLMGRLGLVKAGGSPDGR